MAFLSFVEVARPVVFKTSFRTSSENEAFTCATFVAFLSFVEVARPVVFETSFRTSASKTFFISFNWSWAGASFHSVTPVVSLRTGTREAPCGVIGPFGFAFIQSNFADLHSAYVVLIACIQILYSAMQASCSGVIVFSGQHGGPVQCCGCFLNHSQKAVTFLLWLANPFSTLGCSVPSVLFRFLSPTGTCSYGSNLIGSPSPTQNVRSLWRFSFSFRAISFNLRTLFDVLSFPNAVEMCVAAVTVSMVPLAPWFPVGPVSPVGPLTYL